MKKTKERKGDRGMSMQLNFLYDFGVTREQACIMCHLSSGCGGCCEKCRKEKGYCNNSAQVCSMGSIEHDGQRFVAWINLVKTSLPELKKFVPKKYLK